jgi:adenine-specific DNA-methyltransferase
MPTLTWIGKDKVVNHHHDVPFRVLRHESHFAAPEGSPANSSGNRIIHGDNLEVLKSLLPEFEGKVSGIYIDVPYNTGNEGWVYNDAVNDPKITKWLGQVVGKEGDDLSRHDKWLCMIYPRLKLLYRLLADDGMFLISIDDNEHRYLELVLEEIFGSPNKLETFVWKKSYGGGSKSKHIVNLHEYIICYAKNITKLDQIELPPDDKALKYYKYSDEKVHDRGPYRLQPLATTSMDERPNLRYPLCHNGEEIMPEKQWQWSRDRSEGAQKNDELVFIKRNDKWTVSYKQYLKSQDGKVRGAKPYSIIEGFYTQHGTNEIKALLGDGKAFSFPKPSELVAYLLSMMDKNALVLDSFAGSGTTAHATLKLNAQDGGNRRFILIEMMDYADTITAERVRRVIAGYGDESKPVAGLGGSFDYYTIGEQIFNDDETLNESVGIEAIRLYVSHSEGVPAEHRTTPNNPYTPHLIGFCAETAWIFYYEPEQVTCLDLDFLGSLKFGANKPGVAIIYADKCLLSKEFMTKHGIIFKKIPRDITRF